MHRTTRGFAILIAGFALMLVAVGPALAAEPPPESAHDSVVTVVFHDPEYDNGNGIEGAEIMLWVIDPADGLPFEEHFGDTDASGVATFTEVFRTIDPSLGFTLEASAVRDRTVIDDEGCSVNELLMGNATAPTALEVTIDVEVQEQETQRTCPQDTPRPMIIEGNAVDPDGNALAIRHAEAQLHTQDGSAAVPISTSTDGSFRVEVPFPEVDEPERTLDVTLIGPDVRTVEDEEGCLTTWTLVARGTWTLLDDWEPEPATLVAAEEPLSGVCGGATATPVPAAGLTLPPTDTSAHSLDEGVGGLGAALLLLIAISLASTIAAERRVSRRGG